MTLLRYLWFCYKAYRSPAKFAYFALNWRGVPFLSVAVARDREAWRVSQLAIEALSRP